VAATKSQNSQNNKIN